MHRVVSGLLFHAEGKLIVCIDTSVIITGVLHFHKCQENLPEGPETIEGETKAFFTTRTTRENLVRDVPLIVH